jgi:PIN domain nuclease of toxin-antitoxin system
VKQISKSKLKAQMLRIFRDIEDSGEELLVTDQRAIARTDGLLVCSISIWEIALKGKRGHLALPMSVADYTARLKQIVVAMAIERDCSLISSHRVIKDFYKKTVW